MVSVRKRRLVGSAVVLLAAVLLAGGVWWWCNGAPATTEKELPSPPSTEGPEATTYFRDVTAGSGIDFTYRNGQEANQYAILESLGGGVALIDYDGDGLLDVFVTGGGTFSGPEKKDIKGYPCKLYRNLGGWKFQDVTREVGLGEALFYSHGAAVADYDRDGWPDLLVTGYGRLALYHNVKDDKAPGGRRFVEVTKEAGLLGPHFWSTSAAFADFDGDGYPDLYLCQYVDWSFENNPVCEGYGDNVKRDICSPKQFDSRPHALYRNNGNGTFTDVSRDAGLHAPRKPEDYARLKYLGSSSLANLREADREREYGKGLGVVAVDVNGDGKPDIYVANDTTDKFLYINRSVPGLLRFEDVALEVGAAADERGLPNGSMGVDAGDYERCGRPALLVTNYENELHALYRNRALGKDFTFVFSSQSSGIATIGRRYVGFGTGFLDFDNDGWEDIVICNGHVVRHPTVAKIRQSPLLLRNQGNPDDKRGVQFLNETGQGGTYFQSEHQGRGLAIGDLDNDGRPDLVISHLNEPVVLLRNLARPEHHWLGVLLADKQHRDFVGAKVTLEVNGSERTRFARGGGSYLSSGDRRHLFGLGKADQVGQLTVAWPWGEVSHWKSLAIDRYWKVSAGENKAKPK
jgi:enediyne biosynthesis protein E4